jgi:quercetin dioxygenase-like cupin family protein
VFFEGESKPTVEAPPESNKFGDFMPTIFEPKDLSVTQQNGLSLTTLADAAMLGTDALAVERITLDANANTSTFEASNMERFLYVIRGAGGAQVGGQVFPLEPESILWIEADDSYSLQSGAQGLEVLFCRAPAN